MRTRTDADLAQLEPDHLRAQLTARLRTLPPDAYLRCVAAFLTEYRRLYRDGALAEQYTRIVNAIVALAVRAASGEPVHALADALDREFTALTYPGLEHDSQIQPYDGPLPLDLYIACGAVLSELTDEANRYSSANTITQGAADYEHPHDRLAATRLLLTFLDRAQPSQPVVADPLSPRLAAPDDVPAVLDLLDRTATWLQWQGLPDWLTWPDRHDTVPTSIERGELWLLTTTTGEAAATATLTTDDEGTHVSRLAVRPDLHGQAIGARLLTWAAANAHRNGRPLLRMAAWPRQPALHAYLRRQGFRELWTVAGPPAVSRTLFVRRATGSRWTGNGFDRSPDQPQQ
ncbi:GNAT family N-acetyltransferase [Dactylosporangium sp. NPDC051541]|uniref:GNAT family N-acetyltransferase n=1 Tax=Dactylosporangium sp. NPDC051541 TaxID=3363977 RepID=UPI003792FF58